jgi:hypothetical protein
MGTNSAIPNKITFSGGNQFGAWVWSSGTNSVPAVWGKLDNVGGAIFTHVILFNLFIVFITKKSKIVLLNPKK